MPGKVNEGMTRTRSPHGVKRQGGRVAFAALAAAALLLALVWVSFSILGGEGGRVAEAQTAPDEPGGAVQSGGDAGTLPDNDPDYAAFGEERNPFNPVLSQAATDDTTAEAGTGDGGADANANTDSNGAESGTSNGGPDAEAGNNTTGGQNATGQSGSSRDDNTSQTTSNADPAGNGTVTAPNGEKIDCSDTQADFERIICEDERNGGGSDGPAAGQTGAGGRQGQQGPPGSGGSGRSGAGEQTDDFRNGGGGVSK